MELSTEEIRILKHMVGSEKHISRRKWGYRNRYAAYEGTPQDATLKLLTQKGMVKNGHVSQSKNAPFARMIHYFCTESGCRAAGLPV